jgi:endoglucanase
MGVGYPGVTKDVRSNRWDSGDKDDVDNNWRWGSNRLLLDDAVVLAYAAEEKARAGEKAAAAAYARHAVRVMDYILGTNAMALSMVTGFGENAVERLHDPLVPDTEPGKMALGPNDWTNAGDPDMPAFGSLPGMKMMPVKGRGWAAREVAIDGNAPLVWMAWWAEHRAAALLAP